MYLHLGQNEIVPDHRIIGIFDLDKCSYEKRTREYLTRAEKDGVVLMCPATCRSPLWCATIPITGRSSISAS